MSEYKLSMTASDVEKALGNALATNFFEMDVEICHGGEDACGRTVDYLAFTNMEQVKNAFDNGLIITVRYVWEFSGDIIVSERRYCMHAGAMSTDRNSDGTIFFEAYPTQSLNPSIQVNDALVTVVVNADYEKGIITPSSAKIRSWGNGRTLVKVYAAPF